MNAKCRVCGKSLESKMDQHRGAHLACNPKPRDQRGIERDPAEPIDRDGFDDDRPTK